MPTSVEGDDAESKQPCAGTTLAAGATCDVKLSAGYAGTGTTQFSCNSANPPVLTNAELATSGCLEGYLQSSKALNGVVTAKLTAPTAGTEGTCVQCVTDGPAPAAASFADATPAACPACTLANMGTAGGCLLGCPTDTFQATAKGTGGADATCTACDKTKYQVGATGTALETNAETATSTNACGAKGCRLNYYQTGGTPTVATPTDDVAADCVETIMIGKTANTCVAKATVDTKRCNAATADKATGVLSTVAADQACTFTAAVVSAAGTDCTAITGADLDTSTACDAKAKCTYVPKVTATA